MSNREALHSDGPTIWWRWRFQPVLAGFGHLGIDFTFENPHEPDGDFLLRHVDYGLPGDRTNPDYRHSIALYCAMVAPRGEGWPPLRTPRGRVFRASLFRTAPRGVGDFLMRELPRFWGPPGAYRTLGPNSNTGLRAAVEACSRATGYRFAPPPLRFRLGALGWSHRAPLAPEAGPYPGYFDDATRFRWRAPA